LKKVESQHWKRERKKEVSKIKETGGPMRIAEGKTRSHHRRQPASQMNLILISNEDRETEQKFRASSSTAPSLCFSSQETLPKDRKTEQPIGEL
jgi:hypothetical protein